MSVAPAVPTPTIRRALLAGFLPGARPQTLERLAQVAVGRSFVNGEFVWRSGEQPAALTLVAQGVVKIVRDVPDGTRALVALFGPREAIGLAALARDTWYPAHAIVSSRAATLVQVDGPTARAAMREDPAVAEAIQAALVSHTGALHDKILVLHAGTVERRLALLFVQLAERFGDQDASDRTVLPLALDRGELAQLVGTTVETTIRTMSRWSKDGVVETFGDGFVIPRLAHLDEIARDRA